MDSINRLSVEQRDTLIKQIDRRIARMPDEALIQLETFTRLSQAIPSTPVDGTAAWQQPPAAQKQPTPVEKGPEAAQALQPEGKITRRQSFLYGMGGMITLVAASTGTGWVTNSSKLQTLRDRLNVLLIPLLTTCYNAAQQKSESSQQVQDFQASLPTMYQRISGLRIVAEKMSSLQDNLQKDNLLGKILDACQNKDVLSLIGAIGSIAGNLETFFDYLMRVPDLVLASQDILGPLDQWFSEQSDINARLFQPLQVDLFHSIDDICNDANQLNQLNQSEL